MSSSPSRWHASGDSRRARLVLAPAFRLAHVFFGCLTGEKCFLLMCTGCSLLVCSYVLCPHVVCMHQLLLGLSAAKLLGMPSYACCCGWYGSSFCQHVVWCPSFIGQERYQYCCGTASEVVHGFGLLG
jgi:hypothetical protein